MFIQTGYLSIDYSKACIIGYPTVVVDIDGTIAHVGERIKYLHQTPKDWDSFYAECFDDKPIQEIIDLLISISHKYQFIFCTGRRETVRNQTEKWLDKHGLKGMLLMRADNDYRHDTEVKPEQLKSLDLITHDQIKFILEDRNVMVAKWRELGYKCLHVADGNF